MIETVGYPVPTSSPQCLSSEIIQACPTGSLDSRVWENILHTRIKKKNQQTHISPPLGIVYKVSEAEKEDVKGTQPHKD